MIPRTAQQRKAMGAALKEARIEQDVTQTELAAVVGYRNQSNISQIECGSKGLTRDKLAKAARYLGIRPEALTLSGDEVIQ